VTVYLVGAGPGDPGLLTRRGTELLSRADVVLYDRLVSPAVVALAPPEALRIDVGKEHGGGDAAQERRQDEIARLLVEHGRRRSVVVRLKGGDPFVFGRGGEEADVLSRAGIPWEVVPGVTSAFGVPALAGIPVTQRGLASSVTVVTGRVGESSGPGGVGEGGPDWEALARAGGTLVILMGTASRAAIADALVEGGRAPDTPVAVVSNGTLPDQRVTRTTLGSLGAVELEPPAVIVVGSVAALGSDATPGGSTGPLAGRTVVVTRAGSRATELVAALSRAGAAAIEVPLTQQVDPSDGGAALRAAAAGVRDHQWVVLTSVNAAVRFMSCLRDARALGSILVAAVGPATADALRRVGVEPDLVPEVHSARGLVETFPSAPAGRASVLFPCADIAADTLERGLTQKGWDVQRVEAYRTVPVEAPDPADLALLPAADALTFASPSAVEAYVALRSPEAVPVQAPAHVVCIGATTAAAARDAGFADVHQAQDASAEGIVAELVELFGSGPDSAP
jgi:uroporphyrinogen III methyltransferase / synthase